VKRKIDSSLSFRATHGGGSCLSLGVKVAQLQEQKKGWGENGRSGKGSTGNHLIKFEAGSNLSCKNQRKNAHGTPGVRLVIEEGKKYRDFLSHCSLGKLEYERNYQGEKEADEKISEQKAGSAFQGGGGGRL